MVTMMIFQKVFVFLAAVVATVSANEGPTPNVEAMDYSHDGYGLQGFVAKPEGVTADNPVPAVVIIP